MKFNWKGDVKIGGDLLVKDEKIDFSIFLDKGELTKYYSKDEIDMMFNNIGDTFVNVDAELNTTSENPVQNKVITTEIKSINTRLDNLEDSDVSANFLTKDGFGNLRFYNGVFQYYNTDTSAWTDCEVTDKNSYILQMVPQEMKRVLGWYDPDESRYKLLFEEPADTVIDGQVATVVDSIYVMRKLGSMPQSIQDGVCVEVIERSAFGSYKYTPYVDTTFKPADGAIWYYKLIPHSTSGFYNTSNTNGTKGLESKSYRLFGYKVARNDSDPYSRVTYTDDCVGFTSAVMDYTAGVFDYGTWGILNPWFLSENKPCAVKFDGTVDYYMNPLNYALKEDGTPSDYNNADYEGNMMAQIPKVYVKRWEDSNYRYCQISDQKVDEDFKCYAHLNANQQELDYIYLPMFKGTIDSNGKLRSYSGYVPKISTTEQSEYNAASACGDGWYIFDWSSVSLIQDLLVLLGKSTNSQSVYGQGYTVNSEAATTGTTYNKGQFYGTTSTTQNVKMFHIENFYSRRWERIAGITLDNGIYKYKMFPDYDINDNNFIDSGISRASSNGFILDCTYGEYGCIPISTGGSSTTYECDQYLMNSSTSGVFHLLFGGAGNGSTDGCFSFNINSVPVSGGATTTGASPVFKSLKG